MPLANSYSTGAITVTQGSIEFTGTGTLWRARGFRDGDFVIVNNGIGMIQGVNEPYQPIASNTSGQFKTPWKGASGTFPYNMVYRADDSRLTDNTQQVLELLASGNLEAFAALNGAEDMLPIFTGAYGLRLIAKSELGVADRNGLLSELADLTKTANQFLILGTDGKAAIKPISELTDAIENNRLAIVTNTNAISALDQSKFNKPSGTTSQYLQGDGTTDNKTNLPVSTATQIALDAKASLSGAAFSGDINLERPRGSHASGAYNDAGRVSSLITDAGASAYMSIFGQEHAGNTFRAIFECVYGVQSGLLIFNSLGNLSVPGTLSKGGGTFLIDHPLDPFNKNLRHGFVESTEYLNLYRGLVTLENGRMNIDIDAAFGMSDGTFAALNADVMVTSLQNQNDFDRVCIQGDPSTGKFTIVCENETSTAQIAWMVSGRRKDAFVLHLDENCERGTGRFIPEYDKENI